MATQGNFPAATRALNMTRPTPLESGEGAGRDLGHTSVRPRRPGVFLTEPGTHLHRVTYQLHTLHQEADEILSVAGELSTGRIRMGSDGSHHLILIVAEFSRRYPEPDLSLDMGNADRVLSDLRKPRIDVAVLARADPDPLLRALPFSETLLEIKG